METRPSGLCLVISVKLFALVPEHFPNHRGRFPVLLPQWQPVQILSNTRIQHASTSTQLACTGRPHRRLMSRVGLDAESWAVGGFCSCSCRCIAAWQGAISSHRGAPCFLTADFQWRELPFEELC